MGIPVAQGVNKFTSHEGLLYKVVTSIFPNSNVQQKVRKDLDTKYPTTGSYMEYDIWIPELNLSFEFQDSYHYVPTWYSQHTTDFLQFKDNIKAEAAKKNGLTLIVVPCWWNGSVKDLASTISFSRPDLVLSNFENIIPLNPTQGFFSVPVISGVGELMLASFPTQGFDNNSKWWMGEKYDGVRFCWSPNDIIMYSRQGRKIAIPENFINNLPACYIDGELWFGRGLYSFSFMLIKDSDCNWKLLRMLAFDIPSYDLQQLKYEKRYENLLENLSYTHPFMFPSWRVQYNKSTIKFIQNIIDGGGEGVILQKRGSLYEQGRSASLMKLKVAQGDNEAMVVGFTSQNSVILKLPNETRFVVAYCDVFIPTPFIGEIVTFSTNSLNSFDSHPKIYRVRDDITWDDVVKNFHRERQYLNVQSAVPNVPKQKQETWTASKMQNFLLEFAKMKDLDPYKPSTWIILHKQFNESKSGRSILWRFGNRYLRAINKLLPSVKFDFDTLLKYNEFWTISANRRNFFENYAAQNNFNPLVAYNWYSETKGILALPESKQVLRYHGGSVTIALLDLFPNIGLEKSKFMHQILWDKVENRKKFFVDYAASKGFDPLVASNWYSQPRDKIKLLPRANSVLNYHNQSVSKALLELFPNIGLDKSKFFSHFNPAFWGDKNNRRKFFEEYAKTSGFDPLVAANWYLQSRDAIKSVKKASSVLFYHNNSVSQALLDLFPEIGLDKNKFQIISTIAWDNKENRKQYFINYAKKHNFDPLSADNWYSQIKQIKISKGASRVLFHHKNSVANALLDLFPDIGLERKKFSPFTTPTG